MGYQFVRPVVQAHPRKNFLKLVLGAAVQPEAGIHQFVELAENEGKRLVDQPNVGRVGGDGTQDAFDEVGGPIVEPGIDANRQARRAGQFGLGPGAANAQEMTRLRQQEGDIVDDKSVKPVAAAIVQQILPEHVGLDRHQVLIAVEQFQLQRFVGPQRIPHPAGDAAEAQLVDTAPAEGLHGFQMRAAIGKFERLSFWMFPSALGGSIYLNKHSIEIHPTTREYPP